jgi:hypothetical protein
MSDASPQKRRKLVSRDVRARYDDNRNADREHVGTHDVEDFANVDALEGRRSTSTAVAVGNRTRGFTISFATDLQDVAAFRGSIVLWNIDASAHQGFWFPS